MNEQLKEAVGEGQGSVFLSRARNALTRNTTADKDDVAEAIRYIDAAIAATGKQQADAPQFHHVKKVAEHFNMAVTPKEMAEAIAGAPDSLFSMEAAHKAFAGIGKQQVGAVQEPVLFAVESKAFEAHAASRKLNLDQHPLHYLFLDRVTDEARQAWKAALGFAPPAQAVDLGQFRQAVLDQFELARSEETSSPESQASVAAAAKRRDSLMAVIDGEKRQS